MRRLSVFVAVLGLVASLAAPSAVTASSRPIEYLALGDSLAFGFNPLVDPSNPDNFVGYPEIATISFRDTLTNASCPGETSSHFISITGTDNGCGTWRGFGLPLHAGYDSGTQTQLEFADAFLQAHPRTQVISLDIGANDLFALQKSCSYDTTCILGGLPGMLANLSANLDTIYGHIRNVDGYHHKLVGLTFYVRDYTDLATAAVVAQVNQVLKDRTEAWGGVVADGFAAFGAASTAYGGNVCAAGLLIVTATSPLTCDDHPSQKGAALLAQTLVSAVRPD